MSEFKFHCDMGHKDPQSFKKSDRYVHFKEFCDVGLSRLSLGLLQDSDMLEIWKKAQPISVRQFEPLSLDIFQFLMQPHVFNTYFAFWFRILI